MWLLSQIVNSGQKSIVDRKSIDIVYLAWRFTTDNIFCDALFSAAIDNANNDSGEFEGGDFGIGRSQRRTDRPTDRQTYGQTDRRREEHSNKGTKVREGSTGIREIVLLQRIKKQDACSQFVVKALREEEGHNSSEALKNQNNSHWMKRLLSGPQQLFCFSSSQCRCVLILVKVISTSLQ